MAAVLAPWPFLDGGATAVQVATIFDGATVDDELLWRGAGGRVAARLADGDVEVRLGGGGFELVMARACDGEARVGTRVVELRELSLCGATVLPLGPRTRVTVRAGLLTFAIAGTTPPRRLPLGPPVSWRRRAGIAAAALAGTLFVAALQSTAPRRPSWDISDGVRVKVSMMLPSLHGGQAPSAREERAAQAAAAKPPAAQSAAAKSTAAKAAAAKATATANATANATATATAAATALDKSVPNQDHATATASSSSSAPAQREPGERLLASADDARRAAALQARAAGAVGALAQFRASFLGDVRVAASDVSDTGAIALGAGDASSSSGASGAADGSDGAGAGAGGMGTLSGDEIGESDGVGGIGISGIGEGGGGAGDGTIGLGDLGTIGYGSGTGTGYGYGAGVGDLGGRRSSVPSCTFGRVNVRGSCDADLIRRVVRAHLNEVRFCYEKVLQSRPTLTGRSTTHFLIGYDGRVSASAADGLPEVDACLADAVRRWAFSPRCAAAVSYPFTFVPGASAP
jgi:hypothetical protein